MIQRYRNSRPDYDLWPPMETFQGFPLIEEVLSIAGRTIRIARIADVDALFSRLLDQPSDHPDVKDERIPYWAEVWPSAIGLSEYLVQHPHLVAGKRVLEIGCGLGLPGIVAGMLGAQVVLSDYLEEPLALARYNWKLNIGTEAKAMQLDWREAAKVPEVDLLLASDVAYESRTFPFLRTLFEHQLAKGCSILVSEPSRTFARDFFHSLPPHREHALRSTTVLRNGLAVKVNVHALLP